MWFVDSNVVGFLTGGSETVYSLSLNLRIAPLELVRNVIDFCKYQLNVIIFLEAGFLFITCAGILPELKQNRR